jgi:hypothetical protein
MEELMKLLFVENVFRDLLFNNFISIAGKIELVVISILGLQFIFILSFLFNDIQMLRLKTVSTTKKIFILSSFIALSLMLYAPLWVLSSAPKGYLCFQSVEDNSRGEIIRYGNIPSERHIINLNNLNEVKLFNFPKNMIKYSKCTSDEELTLSRIEMMNNNAKILNN